MKLIPTVAAAAALLLSVAASAETASPNSNANADSLDSTKQAAYTCQAAVDGKNQPVKVNAMYGIKNGEVVVAQLKIGDIVTPGMWRDSFPIMNRFVSNDPEVRTVAWTTFPATAANVTEVDGGKYSVADTNGGQHSVVFEDCKLDRAATAALNR